MKHHLLLAVALAGISSPAWALELVRISGTKKTLDKRESSVQTLPRGQSTLTQKQVVYAFALQRMSPEVPEKARIVWILMKEQKDGRLVEAARGEAAPTLPLGREVTLESAPVLLEEREWTGNKNANVGSIASNLAGYGLRVFNTDGEVVAERYEPADLQRTIQWDEPEERPNKHLNELRRQLKEERKRLRDQEP